MWSGKSKERVEEEGGEWVGWERRWNCFNSVDLTRHGIDEDLR